MKAIFWDSDGTLLYGNESSGYVLSADVGYEKPRRTERFAVRSLWTYTR